MSSKAQRIIRMHADIRARRAHIVRMSQFERIDSAYMQGLLEIQEMQIQKLRALLG